MKAAPELTLPGQLQIQPPMGMYDIMGIDNVAPGHESEAVKFLGYYYYLVEASDRIVAACPVDSSHAGSPSVAMGLNVGNPAFGRLKTALNDLPAMPEVRGGAYEARFLQYRGIQLLTVWLKSENGGKDWVYIYEPGRTRLQRQTLMAMDDFLKSVRQIVQEMEANP